MAVAYAVVVPARYDVPIERVYARRRWTALVGLLLTVLALTLGAGTALANRGGAPASTPAVRPPAAGAQSATVYLVQPGDSLWAIAGRFHGRGSRSVYLDRLIEANHGTKVFVGQELLLP